MLITAFYLLWLEDHWKPLEQKIFVDAPLGGWLVTSVIPPPESVVELFRTDASEIIGESGREGFLFYEMATQSFPEK